MPQRPHVQSARIFRRLRVHGAGNPDEEEYYGRYGLYMDREYAREQAYEQGYVEACLAMETAMGADPRP